MKINSTFDFLLSADPEVARKKDEARFNIRITATERETPYQMTFCLEGEEKDIEAFLEFYGLEKDEE